MSNILELVKTVDGAAELVPNTHPQTVLISKEFILPVAQLLHGDPTSYFDQLSCVTGVDNGPEADTMEAIYHLYSIPFNVSIALKVVMPRACPEVESLCTVWKSANWLEREAYDMLGIMFLHHPDLRRILMPADWEGYPLRKDYQELDTYRDVKVKY